MELADRMDRLGTETAFEVLARARELERQGRKVIHLEIGEPDFDTPRNVVEAGVRALQEGATHYTPSAGMEELRRAIATDQSRRKGIAAEPQNVVVTPGGKPIMFYLMLALLEEGDEVVYPDPGFPIYESVVHFLNARGVPIGFVETAGKFRWDVEDALGKIGDRTRLIILNSPSNPVGSVIPADDLRRIAEAACRHDAVVLSDEIYFRIVYDGGFTSIATMPGMAERTCILDGFSKTYAMTGWRLGFGVMPEELAPRIARLVTNCDSCTAAFTQLAGVEALTGPQDAVDEMVAEFRSRRDLVVEGLNAIEGVTCNEPDGAFYAFPSIKGTGMSSREAADCLLYEAGVAVLAGTAFGRNGEGHLRLSYANSYENLERALDRIKSVLEARGRVAALT
ncbi:MAG TPA: pyridoxal phosphate-dependent aminotransferase [Chloroflexota bacterium]|nr:pyridoxal phosphate-dependent aminotransferase [Chloroflexota bacterium]